jgi:FdrA protein
VELIALVRRDAYTDSVTLMRVSAELSALSGVVAAAAVMATALNREQLREAGLLTDEAAAAGAGDLLVAVRAESRAAAEAALARAEALLAERRAGTASGRPIDPRSVLSAARRAGDANIALISVPGPYAAAEAQAALSAGLHVFLFSDHVPLADEVGLKRRAAARGLLVMGPECGTSLLGGVGLGFANRVRRGGIGLVGASGTGLQEVTSLIHLFGGGVSHAIGTGGRDLDEAVGGLTTLQALEWLGRDPGTRVLAVVSKPPSAAVARRVLGAAAATGKPVIACLLGWTGAAPAPVRLVDTLEETARGAVTQLGGRPAALAAPPAPPRSGGGVLGLYTGGSLCEEARSLVGAAGYRFEDFGSERYTRGRPHPMIDPSLRNAAVAAAGADGQAGVLLVDVVLGDGAHADPAAALAPAVLAARASAGRRGRRLHVIGHVVGTDQDPQGLTVQEARLRAAGVLVCPSNRLAAELARGIAGGPDGR